jgi:adenine-specific DNA-methyltransferase
MSKEQFDALAYSLQRGQAVLAGRAEAQRKDEGQFLTPAPIARFMARSLGKLREGAHVLDPAIGSGVLACAVIERAVRDGCPQELSIHGYELDGELYRAACESLATAARWAATRGVTVRTCLEQKDFLFECTPGLTPPSLFSLSEPARAPTAYDCIIANPPYFKLNTDDGRVKAVLGHLKGHTNIYTLFMALAARMLAQQAVACFIVPRSFCSGAYFSAFRRDFVEQVNPLAIHLFESREDAFKRDSVLQENVIITFQPPAGSARPHSLEVSASRGSSDLDSPVARRVAMRHFLGRHNGDLYFRIPVGELDELILEMMDRYIQELSHPDRVGNGGLVGGDPGTHDPLQRRPVPGLMQKQGALSATPRRILPLRGLRR